MPNQMKVADQYREKPVSIYAVQWDGSREQAEIIMRWINEGKDLAEVAVFIPYRNCIEIPTLEGTMQATVSDWVIRDVKGEFYPCKPDIFESSYEKV